MSNSVAKKHHDNPAVEASQRKVTAWNVRDSLGSIDAMRRYDAYVKEHNRRIRQLEKEARGEMSPSGEWYKE